MLKAWDNTTASRKRTRTMRYNNDYGRLGSIAKHRDIFKINLAICLKRQVYNSCMLPAMTCGEETWTLTKQAQNKLADAQTKMERSMLSITCKDSKTNIWVKERTKVINIISNVRKMKWSWAGHINRLKDDRWTSRVTTWRPYDKKRRQWRPAKRWRDDLDKYLCDMSWQARQTWRRHAEAFAQPQDTTAAKLMVVMITDCMPLFCIFLFETHRPTYNLLL